MMAVSMALKTEHVLVALRAALWVLRWDYKKAYYLAEMLDSLA